MTDLALLEIDGTSDLPAAQFADSVPSAGTEVWVVGSASPGTAALWVSSGMMSSTNAVVTADAGPTIGGLLQTDAAASAAAVGGALVDRDGATVGVVVGRVDDSGTTYAVPIGTAIFVAEQLETSGTAQHGSAGFTGIDTASGPTITRVVAGGPAARNGLHPGDVVTSVDGKPVVTMDDVEATVRSYRPGLTVTFEMRRGRNAFKATIELAATSG
jgi:S1-C subfamily serine protease